MQYIYTPQLFSQRFFVSNVHCISKEDVQDEENRAKTGRTKLFKSEKFCPAGIFSEKENPSSPAKWR